MNRGNLQVKLNLIDDTEIDISCFVQVQNPNDGEEVHECVMDAITDYIERYDNMLVDGEAEIYFGDSIMYIIGFSRMEGDEETWGIAPAEGTITLH